MISTNDRNEKDSDDIGLLFHSILRYGEANEGDDWCGCVWLQRVEDIDAGSLAEALYSDEVNIPSVVREWLNKYS